MITHTELFVLNRMLDGKDIPRVPSFRHLRRKPGLLKENQEKLIQKGFMKDHAHLSDKGLLLTKRLEIYKNAVNFIHLQGVWLALCKEQYGVILSENADHEYAIYILKLQGLYDNLKKTYSFLTLEDEEIEEAEAFIEPSELYQKYYEKSPSGFLLEHVVHGKKESSCLYFERQGRKFRYDNQGYQLRPITNQEIFGEIAEMFSYESKMKDNLEYE